ncbi:MAG: RDD family protein, partial [Planctomycetales bacterium]|nr:RDD family protein [Planctomycetales bacterium]
FTSAGLLNRSLALGVDLAWLGLLMVPFIVPGQFASQISSLLESWDLRGVHLSNFLHFLERRMGMVGLFAPLVPAIATWAEWKGWRTPGRYLFQLRVVDAHGLLLDRRKRMLRSLLRNFPVWIGAFSVAFLALGFDMLVLLISPLDEAVVLLNTLPVLGRKRRAVHDRLSGSHVVLDTRWHS